MDEVTNEQILAAVDLRNKFSNLLHGTDLKTAYMGVGLLFASLYLVIYEDDAEDRLKMIEALDMLIKAIKPEIHQVMTAVDAEDVLGMFPSLFGNDSGKGEA